jgi:hypothetical protein
MAKTSTPKKRRWYHNLADAYRLTAAAEPWVGWAMLGSFLGSIGIAVAIGFATGHPVYAGFLGGGFGLTFAMLILSWRVRAVSYAQIEGHPGASMAVLDQIKRGWNIEREPVAINPRTQDLVFRMVGRPGVVLISEGPASRVKRLLKDEEKRITRVVPNVPVHLVQTGREEGQVPLAKLQSKVRKLPKKLTADEVSTVAHRLRSLSTNKLPIPKGIDPLRARPDRKSSRGR